MSEMSNRMRRRRISALIEEIQALQGEINHLFDDFAYEALGVVERIEDRLRANFDDVVRPNSATPPVQGSWQSPDLRAWPENKQDDNKR